MKSIRGNLVLSLSKLLVLSSFVVGCAMNEMDDGVDQANAGNSALVNKTKYASPGKGETLPPPGSDIDYVGTFHVKNGKGTCLAVARADLGVWPGAAGAHPTTGACAPDSKSYIQQFAIYKVVVEDPVWPFTLRSYYQICVPQTGTFIPDNSNDVVADDLLSATCLTEVRTGTGPLKSAPPLAFNTEVIATRRHGTQNFYAQPRLFSWNDPYIEYVLASVLPHRLFRLNNEIDLIETPNPASTSGVSQRWTVY